MVDILLFLMMVINDGFLGKILLLRICCLWDKVLWFKEILRMIFMRRELLLVIIVMVMNVVMKFRFRME